MKTAGKGDAMKSIKLITVLSAFVMILGLAVTQANALTWDLNTSNVNLGISGSFATVDITVVDNTAYFVINANDALLQPPVSGGNYGIDKFFFNSTLSNIAGSINVGLGWEVKVNQNASMFGVFELEYKGTGESRIDPLSFSITDTRISDPSQFYEANSAGYNFAAHIAGFQSLMGQSSAYFADGTPGAPVPEPSTMLLLGAGVLGMGIFGRKRMKG